MYWEEIVWQTRKLFYILWEVFSKSFFLCQMIAEDPDKFKALVQESLRRQVAAINSLADVGKLISKNFQTDYEQTKLEY